MIASLRNITVGRIVGLLLPMMLLFAGFFWAVAYADPDSSVQGDGASEGGGEGDTSVSDQQGVQEALSGLVEIDGKLYFYEDDGTLFTGGYKVVTVDGVRTYYYFTEDGTAFTDGYLHFEQGGKEYTFFFQADGTAFTGGYKEIEIDGAIRYFYFLANGQGFNTGYKTVMIDGVKYYFFFGDDCQAITGSMQSIDLDDRTAYFYLEDNGRAFTGGYKEFSDGDTTDYYYFLNNGQAFTTGYKVVKLDGVFQYFYFQPDGTAFTEGRKGVSFGSSTFYYFFGSDGRAVIDAVAGTDGQLCYYGATGRAGTAWRQIDGSWRYFGADGTMCADTVATGYRFAVDGSCPTKERIRALVDGLVDDTMTDQEKIKTVFDWLVENDMTYISNLDHAAADWTWYDGWVDDFANQMLDDNGGNCFRYASLLGLMVSEATGLDVRVVTGKTKSASGYNVPHGWIEVLQDGSWYIYDAEMVKFAENFPYWKGYRLPHEQGPHYAYFPSTLTDLFD